MLKQYATIIKHISIVIDTLITGISFYLAHLLTADNVPFKECSWLLLMIIPLWLFLLANFGVYESHRTKKIRDLVWIILKAITIGTLILISIAFLFNITVFSPAAIGTFITINITLLICAKLGIFSILRFIRKKGYNSKRILIVGIKHMAQDFTHLVHAHPEWGLKIVGFIDFDTQNVGKEVLGYKILGTPKDIPEIFHKEVIDEVVFALHRKYLDLLDETLKLCEEEGIGAHIALADWFHVSISKTQFENFHGLPMITFNPIPLTEMQLFIKGIFDRVCALILLILFSPIFLITAIAIKLTSKGPVFFKQPRCGIHGRQFIMYKFRSMVNGADKQLESLKHKNEMSGPVFKMKDDPRITPLGKFLRRTSIDELPQLINVLKGDMSLVGPRPLMPWEVAGFDKWQRRRMSMPPGITCIWQVNGRNHIDFDKWMKLDLQYIDNWSFALDAKLLLQTIPAVLFKKGAC